MLETHFAYINYVFARRKYSNQRKRSDVDQHRTDTQTMRSSPRTLQPILNKTKQSRLAWLYRPTATAVVAVQPAE